MKLCSVEGCGKKYLSGGYCNGHYLRSRKGASLTSPIKERRDTCTKEGCNEKHYGAGFCRNHYNKHRRDTATNALIDYLGGCCQDCGNKFITAVYDFHHRNPEEKEYSISDRVDHATIEELKKEADKCDLLCSNCHRIRHANE